MAPYLQRAPILHSLDVSTTACVSRIQVGLPQTITFLLEYSFVNTESTLLQAVNDEEGVMGQRTWGTKDQNLEQA